MKTCAVGRFRSSSKPRQTTPNYAKLRVYQNPLYNKRSRWSKVTLFFSPNRWESSVSAIVKNKWHTYCVLETPNRWEPIVVTGHFAFWHTLQHFREVMFPVWHTLQHFREVIFSTLALGAFGEPKVIWGGFGEALGRVW